MNCLLPYFGGKPKNMLDFKDITCLQFDATQEDHSHGLTKSGPFNRAEWLFERLLSLQLFDFSFMSSSINILQCCVWHCKMCFSM